MGKVGHFYYLYDNSSDTTKKTHTDFSGGVWHFPLLGTVENVIYWFHCKTFCWPQRGAGPSMKP